MAFYKGAKGEVKHQRLVRCLRLVDQLQSGVRRSVSQLAEELGVSRRTVHRDLNLVQDAGLGLHFNLDEKRYKVHAPLNLNSAVMTKADWTTLLLAAHVLSHSMDPPARQALGRIISKTVAQFPAAIGDDIVRVLNAVSADGVFTSTSWPGTDCPHLDKILLAIREKHYLRIRFLPAGKNRQPEQTKLTPAGLMRSRGEWCLVGRSSLHRTKTSFPISRILEVEVLEERFL